MRREARSSIRTTMSSQQRSGASTPSHGPRVNISVEEDASPSVSRRGSRQMMSRNRRRGDFATMDVEPELQSSSPKAYKGVPSTAPGGRRGVNGQHFPPMTATKKQRPSTVPAFMCQVELKPETHLSLLPKLDSQEVTKSALLQMPEPTKSPRPALPTRLGPRSPMAGRSRLSTVSKSLSSIHMGAPVQVPPNKWGFSEVEYDTFMDEALEGYEEWQEAEQAKRALQKMSSLERPTSADSDEFGYLDDPNSPRHHALRWFEDDLDNEEDSEGQPKRLHYVVPPPSRPGTSEAKAVHVLHNTQTKVTRIKRSLETLRLKTAQGWELGHDPLGMEDNQILAIPRNQDMRANIGAPEAPRDLGHRLMKRLEKSELPNSPTKSMFPKITHFDRPKTTNCGNNTLNLAYSLMGPRELYALSLNLPHLKTLQTICMPNNAVDDNGIRTLVAGLRRANCIRNLDVSNNKITQRGARYIAESLFQPPDRNADPGVDDYVPALSHLNLSKNNIGDRGIIHLANHIRNSASLRDLDVADCWIKEEGGQEIGDAVSDNKSLIRLNLSGNKIGLKGAMALGEGLRNHPQLKILLLSHMGLGDIMTAHICQNLQENNSVMRLSLSENNIRSSSTAVLVTALVYRGHMEYVDISNNPIGAYGAKRILGVIRNGTLVEVNLLGCSFLEIGWRVGEPGIINQHNPDKFYNLDLANPLDKQVACDLVELWKQHGPASWVNASLSHKPMTLTEDYLWPEQMPRKGHLRLKFQSAKMGQKVIEPMPDKEFRLMWESCRGKDQSDEWKVSWFKLLMTTVYFTSKQVAELLECFSWESERLHACTLLFGRLTDPENQNKCLQSLSGAGKERLYKEIGPQRYYDPKNPTGKYRLNLSMPVDFCIAEQLLCLYAQEEMDGVCERQRLQQCWRNVVLEGRVITEEIDPHTYKIPTSGTLAMDYVTYRVPISRQEQKKLRNHGLNPPKYKAFSDLSIEALIDVICMEKPPYETFNLKEYTDNFFHKNFESIWDSNMRKMTTMQEQKMAKKNAKAMMKAEAAAAGAIASMSGGSRSGSIDMAASALMKGLQQHQQQQQQQGSSRLGPQGVGTTGTGGEEEAASSPSSGANNPGLTKFMMQNKPRKGSLGDGAAPNKYGGRKKSVSGDSRRVPAENREGVMNALRVLSAEMYLYCRHLLNLCEVFQEDDFIIEVVVIFYARIIDRDRFSMLMRSLSPRAQGDIGQRLGWINFVDYARPDHHFKLRLYIRDECDVARKLTGIAKKDRDVTSINNLHINGRHILKLTEDDSLWSILTGHVMDGVVPTNVLEFDFAISKQLLYTHSAHVVQKWFRKKGPGSRKGSRA